MSAQHTPEIMNLIAVALHAPTTGCVSIQGALFLDIISKLETAEQQRDALLAALQKYGRHTPGGCHHLNGFGCDCGLNEAIAKAQEVV